MAVMVHAEVYDAEVVRKDEYRTTYAVTGALTSPDGRNPVATAYRIIRAGDPRPALTSIFRRT